MADADPAQRCRKALGWELQPSACLNCSRPGHHDHVLQRPPRFCPFHGALQGHALDFHVH